MKRFILVLAVIFGITCMRMGGLTKCFDTDGDTDEFGNGRSDVSCVEMEDLTTCY